MCVALAICYLVLIGAGLYAACKRGLPPSDEPLVPNDVIECDLTNDAADGDEKAAA